jgi:hypothetical protein
LTASVVAEPDRCAALGQAPGDGGADSAARAGDERDAAGESLLFGHAPSQMIDSCGARIVDQPSTGANPARSG